MKLCLLALVSVAGWVATPPAPPTGVTATQVDPRIRLNWNSSSGATGYNIYRALVSEGAYTKLNSSPVSGTE